MTTRTATTIPASELRQGDIIAKPDGGSHSRVTHITRIEARPCTGRTRNGRCVSCGTEATATPHQRPAYMWVDIDWSSRNCTGDCYDRPATCRHYGQGGGQCRPLDLDTQIIVLARKTAR